MLKLCIFILCLFLLGAMIVPDKSNPNPNYDARIKALEARVTTLELWAVRHGAKF